MSKRAFISRYLLILKKLRTKPYSSYNELQGYMENQFEFLQANDETIELAFSKKTFERDKNEISKLFGVNIEYSAANKGYFIAESQAENENFQRMIEAFDMFNSLNLAQDLKPFIYMEKRKPQGTENLYGLIHAIKNKLQIKFAYQKFWEEKITQRTAEPYALKEFKNRWYLMANNDGSIKSFALDRLTNLEITTKYFKLPTTYNIEESYRFCFGIISPNGAKPQEIILSFDPFQGKYIKTLPLHETQEILLDNEDELQIKLKLCITHDLVMELLSFGDNMKVLQPIALIEEIKMAHQKAYQQY
ncbi:MAG: WYL domain-containing protein [Chitinophagaceae bacterium]|nr:WYL domain-containing protein [Chitinophagaceae bacterium]